MTGDAAKTTFGNVGTTGTNVTGVGGAVSLIDASSLTGESVIDLTGGTFVPDSASTGLTVKGGSGKDTITGKGGNTIYGNAGDDTIIVGDGASTLYGGAGNDTFTVTAAVGTGDIVKIMDLAAGDKIDFGTATAYGATAVDVSAQSTLLVPLEQPAELTTRSATSITTAIPTSFLLVVPQPVLPTYIVQLVGDVDLSLQHLLPTSYHRLIIFQVTPPFRGVFF